jgi:predicted Zn-dependent peptidase
LDSIHYLKIRIFYKHKGIIEQEYQRIRANPESYAPRLAFGILYPHQPVGNIITGNSEQIAAIERQTLDQFLQEKYSALDFIIVVCGKCTESNVIELAEKYFAEMKSFKTDDITLTANYHKEIISLRNVQMYLKRHFTSAIMPLLKMLRIALAAEFIATILSRGKLSRLTKRIRDELGLAYVIDAYTYTGLKYGLFAIYSGMAQVSIPNIFKCHPG